MIGMICLCPPHQQRFPAFQLATEFEEVYFQYGRRTIYNYRHGNAIGHITIAFRPHIISSRYRGIDRYRGTRSNKNTAAISGIPSPTGVGTERSAIDG